MKRRVYLSGPITGYELTERQLAFSYFEDFVNSKEGFEAVNPLNNGVPQIDGNRPQHMRTDIRNLLECDYIYMLPDWYKAEGCKLELDVATACGITPFFILEELMAEYECAIAEDEI